MAKFCPNCGFQMEDYHQVCGQCGMRYQSTISGVTYNQNQPPMINPYGMYPQPVQEKINYALIIVGFFIPIVGWIAAAILSNKQPKTSRYCAIAGCIGFVVNLIILNMG